MKRSPIVRRTPLRRSRLQAKRAHPSTRDRIPTTVRDAVRARSGGRCEIITCTAVATDMHHRLMRSQGGGHTLGNLLHVCRACHRRAHDYPADSYRAGLLIRRKDTP